MASTLGYATLADLQNLLLVDVDSTFQAQVETWISGAEVKVNNYLGYTTASGLWNEAVTGEIQDSRVDGDLNLVVYPRKRPINSVSKLELWKGTENISLTLTDGVNTKYIIPVQKNCIVYPSFETETSNSSYALTNFGQIKFSRWYTKMDYIGGYTSIPLDIAEATILLASDTFMRHANKEGLVSIAQGRVSKRWQERKDGKSDLEEQAYRTLDHYKIASGWW
jgi:hypothetical protein